MFVVTLLPDGVRLPVRDGETVDAALVRAGFARSIRGCRQGGCGACRAVLHEGAVVDQRPIATRVLSGEQRADGQVLLCRAVPTSDVTVSVVNGSVRCVSPIQRALAERELTPTGGS